MFVGRSLHENLLYLSNSCFMLFKMNATNNNSNNNDDVVDAIVAVVVVMMFVYFPHNACCHQCFHKHEYCLFWSLWKRVLITHTQHLALVEIVRLPMEPFIYYANEKQKVNEWDQLRLKLLCSVQSVKVKFVIFIETGPEPWWMSKLGKQIVVLPSMFRLFVIAMLNLFNVHFQMLTFQMFELF